MMKKRKQSGDPRKRHAVEDTNIINTSLKRELLTNHDITTDLALDMFELFEKQHPESSGLLFNEKYYLVIFGALATHRKACELGGKPSAYNPLTQLNNLPIGEVMKEEIMDFLEANNLVKI